MNCEVQLSYSATELRYLTPGCTKLICSFISAKSKRVAVLFSRVVIERTRLRTCSVLAPISALCLKHFRTFPFQLVLSAISSCMGKKLVTGVSRQTLSPGVVVYLAIPYPVDLP